MSGSTPSLVFPSLAPLYAFILPWVEALLRVVVGLAFVPHGLRATFGLFAAPDGPPLGFRSSIAMLDQRGFRPGRVWMWGLIVTQLVAAPLLALGLFTRPAALVCCALLLAVAVDRGRSGWFWNRMGAEYAVVWAVAVLYFVAAGGGPYSLDAVIGVTL